jgi:hypothetical protein
LDETTTGRFSAKKIDTCRKKKSDLTTANILGTFEEVLDIYDAFASDTTAPDRFLRDFLVRKISN